MNEYEDFTVNLGFSRNEIDQIRYSGVKWVPIIDIGISKSNLSQSIFDEGIAQNIYIQSSISKQPLINRVWPDYAAFPDFNHPNTSRFWANKLLSLYNRMPFDGIWLDMNEPTTFISGEFDSVTGEPTDGGPRNISNPKDFHSWDLPFWPGGNFSLEHRAINLNALHVANGEFIAENLTEFTFHGLHGLLESVITAKIMKENLSMPLPFILSRNTLFGQGKYTAHWTGDNVSLWMFLRTSIAEIFNFGLFGIPFVGADICGFGGSVIQELCARWMQVGSFYPFARNHNQKNARPQEPYAWGEDSDVLKASLASLRIRYSILKWYYSLFVRNEGKGTVFRPVFFEFPDDERILQIEDQFLLGSEIMIAPCLNFGQTNKTVIFPGMQTWFNFNFQNYSEINAFFLENNVTCPLDSNPPIFIRAGTIVFVQNVQGVKNVNDLNNVFWPKVALKENGKGKFFAKGIMMGINDYSPMHVKENCLEKNCLFKIEAFAVVENSSGMFNFTLKINAFKPESVIEENLIEKIEIYGVNNTEKIYTYEPSNKILIKNDALINFLI